MLDFRLLGPLEARRGGQVLDLGGSKQKALLAVLLIHANEVVSTERFMDLLWEDDPPKTAGKVLQVYVSQLRKILEPENNGEYRVLVTRPQGYMLRLEPDRLDVQRFERLLGDARGALDEGSHEVASSVLREALELWRGEPLSDFGHEYFARAERARLEELRLAAIEGRIDVDLALGRHEDIPAELEALVEQFPLRERLARQSMLTLYRCGRQAEALEVFRRIRKKYADDLGIEPGPDLHEFQRKILAQDESLQWRPVRSRALAHNIPERTTTFVGRNEEIQKVIALLSGSRLVTLTGPGGCGKSRLSIEVASELMDAQRDGVWVVELAPIHKSELVAHAISSVFKLKEDSSRDQLDLLVDHLRDKDLLLLLDNCEHVIEGAAATAETLLRSCPRVRVLATSREPLSIDGELSWVVPPLSVPALPLVVGGVPDKGAEAIRLFVDRASASEPDFRLSEDDLSSVVRICKRLDGMPLAIELAAPRIRSMSLEQIAARIDDALGFLTAGTRTASPRHRTLRAAMDWSYQLLSDLERRVLAQLSTFVGGFTLAAAEAVCRDEEGQDDTVAALSGLIEKSLVSVEDRSGKGRYRLLETIREYAAQKLTESGDGDKARDLHAAFFLALAERAEPGLRGSQQRDLLEKLDQEHQNLRAALHHFGDRRLVDEELRLAAALWRYSYLRGRYSEGSMWLDAALSKEGGTVSSRAHALMGSGALAFYQCDYPLADANCRKALELFRKISDPRGVANSLTLLGAIFRERGDYDRALEIHGEAKAAFQGLEDRWGVAHSLQMSGFAAWLRGSYDDAQVLSGESLQMFRELHDDERTAWALMDLGAVAHYLGDDIRSTNLIRRSLSLFEGLGFKEGIAWSLNLLGLVELERGAPDRARTLLTKSLSFHRELGDRWRLGSVLGTLASADRALGDAKTAVRLLGAADALRLSIGTPVPFCERPLCESTAKALRRELGAEAFEGEWDVGRLMTLEEACDQASGLFY